MFKVHVYVWPKSSILDPQGEAVLKLMVRQGIQGAETVRQGKCFKLEFQHEVTRSVIEDLARNVLSNPVIEDFEIEIVS